MTKKVTTLTVFICILLFIPLVIAVISGVSTDPNSVAANNLKKLTVSHDGYSFKFDDDATFDLYSSISKGAREIDGSFRDFSAEVPYNVTYTEDNDTPITYMLYMSKNTDDCVYVSPDGNYYMMDTSVAEKLVVREEFSSLNEFKALPVATFSGFGEGIELKPDSYSWTYTALDGSKPSLNGEGTANNPLIKFDDTALGSIKIDFDKTPDSLTLKITDDSGVVFDDKYENLSATNMLTYSNDTHLSLTAVAQWYEIDGAEYYGEASYSVPLLFDVAPSYTVVDANGVPAGDFTVLRINNFNNGEKLTVSSEIGIPEKVGVYDTESGYKIAFVPMRSDLEKGTYTLKLTTDSGHVANVDVKVSRAVAHDSHTLIFTDENLTKAFTQENFDAFDALVKQYTEQSRNAHLYEGKFAYPTGSSQIASGGTTYGSELDVISLFTKKYTHSGMQLKAADAQAVKASNNGVVVYAGDSGLYGKLVIVDHGQGVLSYYGNLSEITAKEGDTVTKSETVLGKAGKSGFSAARSGAEALPTTMVYFAISIDSVFIDPSSPCKYGINI